VPDPAVKSATVAVAVDDAEGFHVLSRELGVETFGLNVLTLRPGQRNRVHLHKVQEEVYLVLSGELTLVVEGEEMVFGPDQAVRVPPHLRRQLTNRGPEPLRLLGIGAYGEHEPRDALAWTTWDEGGDGGPPRDVPPPPDLPVDPR
jgi:mannose-6-phosphate isomerase-like protein (cupin superfamily)